MKALAVLLIGCAACSSGDTETSPGERVAIATEVARIGSLDRESDSFGQVVGVAVTGDGSRIAVLDSQTRELRIFRRDGSLVKVAGGPGGGPGEFAFPVAVGVVGDTFWVADLSSRRFPLFSSDGVLISDLRVVRGPGADAPAAAEILDDGSLIGSPSIRSQDIASGLVQSVPAVRMSRGGVLLDTLWMRDVANTGWVIESGDSDRGAVHTRQPLVDRVGPVASPALDRIYWVEARGNGTVLVVTSLSGSRVAETDLGLTSAPLADSVVTRVVTVNVEFLSGHRFGQGVPLGELERQVRAGLFVPETRLPIDAMVLASNGSIWLRERPTADMAWWRHLDTNGAETRRVQVPADLVVDAALEHEMWGHTRDGLGVSYVVAFSIGR